MLKLPRIVIIAMMATIMLPSSSQEMIEHVVQRGETFELIAERYGITEQMLRDANSHVSQCYTGITLQIDPADIEAAKEYRKQMEAERRMREQHVLYEQAGQLMDAGKYKDAQKIFDGIISDAPTSLAYYNRGICYFNREKWNDAASDFRSAIYSDDCSEELKEKGQELRNVALKNQEIKDQQRAAMWSDLVGLGLSVASTAMNVSAAKSYSNTTTGMNGLLDPSLAASQVQAQWQAEYEQMRRMNPSLTYEQFLQIRSNAYDYGSDVGSTSASQPSSDFGTTSSSSSGRSRQPRECGACGGTGKVIDYPGSSFGLNKWCDECGKEVPANHAHVDCPSCKGKGYW